jgi:hypothetical protein
MKSLKKVTNEQTSEYDIFIAIPFSDVTISNPKKQISQSMYMLWSAGN